MAKYKTEKLIYQNIKFKDGEDGLLSLEQVAMITGTKRRLLKVLVENELLEPEKMDGDNIKVHVDSLAHLKKMLRLHYDLGIGWSSMPVVLDLLERIDDLEKRIQALKK